MEVFGVIAFFALLIGVLILCSKHQRAISGWVSTPHYNKAYKKKMLKRVIEDAQDELAAIGDDEK